MGDQGSHGARRRAGAVVAGVVLACGALGVVGAAGAAQQAQTTVDVGPGNVFSPADIEIATGDSVVWNFDGSGGTTHNVAGKTGPDPAWTTYASEFKASGSLPPRQFTQPGSYTYVCQAHPAMTGAINVTGAPTEPTPTPTPTTTPQPAMTPTATRPVPDDHTSTPAPGTAAPDRTAPTFSSVALKGRRHAVRVRFRLSETSAVTLRVAARGSGRVLRTVRVQLRPGLRSVTLRSAKLRRGHRYAVELLARDPFGNRSATRRAVVRVRAR